MTAPVQDTLFGDAAPEVRVLTVQQPWAWCLIHLPEDTRKDIENRPREISYRGRILIHAGRKIDPAGVEFCEAHGIDLPAEAFETGHIVGSVDLAGVVTDSPSIWAQPGACHHQMASPVPATRRVTGHRGNLGLQKPPAGWERAFA